MDDFVSYEFGIDPKSFLKIDSFLNRRLLVSYEVVSYKKMSRRRQ